MIDYINIEITKFSVDSLLNNKLLNFGVPTNLETGEIIKTNFHYLKKVSKLDNFNIELNTNTLNNQTTLYLKGSIHKYYTNGTNYNDFDLCSLKKALFDLFNKLDIDIQNTQIHSFEFGVNINTNISVYELINNIVNYKGKLPIYRDFNNTGQIIKFEFTQYILKIYNKGMQGYNKGYFKTNEDTLLRFEIHIDKMQYIQKKGISIYNLNDLLNPLYINQLGSLLINTFNELIIYDSTIDLNTYKPKDKEFLIKCENSKYWTGIYKGHVPKEYKRTKDKFRNLINSNIQNEISKLIENKWQQLAKNVPLLPSVVNANLSDCYPYIVSNKSIIVKKCPITGIEISHQKKESNFLSEQSINEIQKTDIELYKSLILKFASKKPKGKINYFIAHNIRNQKFNDKHNFKKRYLKAIEQTQLFNINDVLRLTETQKEYLR